MTLSICLDGNVITQVEVDPKLMIIYPDMRDIILKTSSEVSNLIMDKVNETRK